MTVVNLQQSMTNDDRAKFERGVALLKELQDGRPFETHWVPIGEGLLAIRRTVMTALSLKKAKGGYYNDAFGRLCAKTPYAEMHKVSRSNLLYCMEHLADLVEMRAGWTPTDRVRINHPDTLAKKLREFLNRAPEDKEQRPNASPMALLREKNETLTRANLDLAEKIAHLETRDGSLFDLKLDNAEAIVDAIVGELSKSKSGKAKAKAIADGILARLKEKTLQPAG
jgi:hypothetical protein